MGIEYSDEQVVRYMQLYGNMRDYLSYLDNIFFRDLCNLENPAEIIKDAVETLEQYKKYVPLHLRREIRPSEERLVEKLEDYGCKIKSID